MTAQIYTGTEIAQKRASLNVAELVAEYDDKRAALPDALTAFDAATMALKSAATLRGTWGNITIYPRAPYQSTLEQALLQSAWRHVYAVGGFERIASADDKRRFEQLFASPRPLRPKICGRPSKNTAIPVRRSCAAWRKFSASWTRLSKATRR